MKKRLIVLGVLFAAALAADLWIAPPTFLHAQSGIASRVQQDPQMLNACTPINATAAVNTTATVTLTPPSGQYVYICGLDIDISNDATGAVVSTNLSFTSTNFGGWAWKFSAVNAANTDKMQVFSWSTPLRSAAPGTAVTFVSPAINTHAAYSINAYYYFGF